MCVSECECPTTAAADPLWPRGHGDGRLSRNKQETNENKYIRPMMFVFYSLRDDCVVVSFI